MLDTSRPCYVGYTMRLFVVGFVFEAAGREFAVGMRFGTLHGSLASVRFPRVATG